MTAPTTGVVFRPQRPPEALRAAVQAAEQAGVEELGLWEDCFLEGGPTTAAAVLACSERIRVGIGLLPVPVRNAAVSRWRSRRWPGCSPTGCSSRWGTGSRTGCGR